uniref:Uncharacterized protein n=1 Tax=Arundo donax TaxID=35708 RepID=A0A0A8ZF64_ARUDO
MLLELCKLYFSLKLNWSLDKYAAWILCKYK